MLQRPLLFSLNQISIALLLSHIPLVKILNQLHVFIGNKERYHDNSLHTFERWWEVEGVLLTRGDMGVSKPEWSEKNCYE